MVGLKSEELSEESEEEERSEEDSSDECESYGDGPNIYPDRRELLPEW